ncbi:tetraacyldisaccharide 4'-kinase [Jannaschia sp. W003]|uniref:tetraacyldisaccharide 4'-kinase n=1 Tax=Jannaschia sp. W003 TaxID=2867012 RepID=UPI0021A3BCDC|nr:tetraacyldisaccharide 4'-kinase [Jannaschia sp. W003]UWQ21717.1 tetraacyldisaccharide 4'-kinase [Jannaschia sp. W003]
MKAPGFWSRPPGVASALLAPLGALYAAATARRVTRSGLRVGVPVISVGNLSAGGTGKTPVAMDLLGRIPGAHAVTRGHGGRLAGPVRVDPSTHTAADVGDEPLLLAAFAPTWVARDRAAGARAAEAAGARAIVLDDAHQNPALRKDLSIVVVDAEAGWGNGRTIPAGPLREPVAAGLARADLVVSLGPTAAQAALSLPSALPRARGHLAPLRTGMDWQGLPVFAFAGIGRPEKFFATLEALGADLRGTEALADHQPLTTALCLRLGERAAQLGAQPVTTEKDAVRLPAGLRGRVLVLPVRVAWDDDAALGAALEGLGIP